jgi:cobalt-zinc-cadmium efflux system outer membrane protein
LDLAAARQEVLLLQDALNVTKGYRFLGNADVGVETERETDRSRITGPTLALQLPIFNQNQGGVLRAQSSLELAELDLKSLEIGISNDVALAHAKVQITRRSVELLGDQLVPLRQRIVTRTLEQVNYMLVGVFDLIRTKQDEYDTYQTYLEALRDYWLARTALTLAVGAPLPSSTEASSKSVAPEDLGVTPDNGGPNHN